MDGRFDDAYFLETNADELPDEDKFTAYLDNSITVTLDLLEIDYLIPDIDSVTFDKGFYIHFI